MTTSTVIDELLDTSKVLVVAGLGGVGKTTLSASLAARSATRLGRRALVVTIDPARRLTDVLGSETLSVEPILVPVDGEGRLWAQTVDMSHGWNRLVASCAPDQATSERLQANKLYQSLTTRFIRSHDFIALDYLADVATEKKYDLVVVDTPPSTHVLDILDAPDEMMKLFESRLLSWLTRPDQSLVSSALAKPFLAIAERALGDNFLSEVTEFFLLFSELRPAFVARTEGIQQRLTAPGTRFVTVTTPEPAAAASAVKLQSALVERGYHPALTIRNKAWPDMLAVPWSQISTVTNPELRAALLEVQTKATAESDHHVGRTSRVDVAFAPSGITSIDDLCSLID